jgi:riboflavin synthase
VFTGIVEELGEVEAVEHRADSARLVIRSARVTEGTRAGDSIAVNGVCLTVTDLIGGPPGAGDPPGAVTADAAAAAPLPRGFAADVMGETLKRSSLDGVLPGMKVNLERSVRAEDRLGGHIVQGHVDDTATITGRDPQQHWEVVRISLPPGLARYVVHKGSIAVDGVSLTVSEIDKDWFEVSLIPETLKRTTLGVKQPGETVNLEVDVIAKYVEKLIGGTR